MQRKIRFNIDENEIFSRNLLYSNFDNLSI